MQDARERGVRVSFCILERCRESGQHDVQVGATRSEPMAQATSREDGVLLFVVRFRTKSTSSIHAGYSGVSPRKPA